MSAMLAKRIEVRKLSKLSNIQKLKCLIRQASNQRLSTAVPLAVRSAHSIVLKQSEPIFQANTPLQEKSQSVIAFVRSHSRLALGSSSRSTNAEEKQLLPKREIMKSGNRSGHTGHSAGQSSSITPPSFDSAKPTVIVDHKEGPCKRTLRYRAKEPKIVPSYMRLVEEDEPQSIAGQSPRRCGSTAMQMPPQRHDVNDKVVYEVDDSHKKSLHTIRFGKRDRSAINNFQNQLDEARLQQSLSFFGDRRMVNIASRRGNNVYVHPKFQVKQGRGARTPAAVTLKELHEARFGRTLNTLADKKLFKLSSLYTHDYNKFPIEDEMQVQAKLLAKQKANKVKAEKELADEQEETMVVRPSVNFGRRRIGRSPQRQDQHQQPTQQLVLDASKVTQHDPDQLLNAPAVVAASISPNTASAAIAAPGSLMRPKRDDPSENIYRKFLRGEEQEVVEIEAPRFDELYYREKDNLGKNYSQTWQDYPESMLNIVPDQVKLIPPPFKKRPKDERPATAKAWGDVDETSLLC